MGTDIIMSIDEIRDGLEFSLTYPVHNDPDLRDGVVYTFREHSIEKPFAVYRGDEFVKLLHKAELRSMLNNAQVAKPIGHTWNISEIYAFRIAEYVVTDSFNEVYAIVEDLEPDGLGGWRSIGFGVNDEDDRIIDHAERGEGESWEDLILSYLEEASEDDAYLDGLADSEGRRMAGMAFGNQGLADYDGLELYPDHDDYNDYDDYDDE